LSEAHPGVPDPQSGRARGKPFKESEVGLDLASLLPVDHRVKPQGDAFGTAGDLDQGLKLPEGRLRLGHSPFHRRPAEPGDREMEVELPVFPESVPQTGGAGDERSEVFRPENERMNALRAEVDDQDTARRSQDLRFFRPDDAGQPIGEEGDKVGPPGSADDLAHLSFIVP